MERITLRKLKHTLKLSSTGMNTSLFMIYLFLIMCVIKTLFQQQIK